jgi:hypothetical protein
MKLGLDARTALGFCCKPLPGVDGHTWTLTTLLGTLLAEAEERFGPRDATWTPIGIEFGGDNPHVWYPGNRRHVSIMLSETARENPGLALFQLAHEVIHLLAPTGTKGLAPVLEEGLATLFSCEISLRYDLDALPLHPRYLGASSLVQQLLGPYPDAVMRMRERQPNFHRLTAELIQSVVPGSDPHLASDLCKPFSSYMA